MKKLLATLLIMAMILPTTVIISYAEEITPPEETVVTDGISDYKDDFSSKEEAENWANERAEELVEEQTVDATTVTAEINVSQVEISEDYPLNEGFSKSTPHFDEEGQPRAATYDEMLEEGRENVNEVVDSLSEGKNISSDFEEKYGYTRKAYLEDITSIYLRGEKQPEDILSDEIGEILVDTLRDSNNNVMYFNTEAEAEEYINENGNLKNAEIYSINWKIDTYNKRYAILYDVVDFDKNLINSYNFDFWAFFEGCITVNKTGYAAEVTTSLISPQKKNDVVEPTIQPEVEPTIQPEVEPTIQPEVAPTIQPEVAPINETSLNKDVDTAKVVTSTPNTGDNSNIWINIIIMFSSIIFLGMFFVLRTK